MRSKANFGNGATVVPKLQQRLGKTIDAYKLANITGRDPEMILRKMKDRPDAWETKATTRYSCTSGCWFVRRAHKFPDRPRAQFGFNLTDVALYKLNDLARRTSVRRTVMDCLIITTTMVANSNILDYNRPLKKAGKNYKKISDFPVPLIMQCHVIAYCCNVTLGDVVEWAITLVAANPSLLEPAPF